MHGRHAETTLSARYCPMGDRMKSFTTLMAVFAAALLLVRPAHAEPPASEDMFLGELPQVLSATRLRQPLSETPASVTVIDRQMIEASGALDIPSVLRLVPGFQVSHVINGNQYTVTYHGLSDAYARRMQVLIDGRSVYTASFGGVQWGEIPLAMEDIDRIEVIRGPNGAAYGANSFSAIINIITQDAAEARGGLAKYTRGDVNTRNGLLRYGGGTDDFDYRLTLAHREDDGFDVYPNRQRTNLLTYRGDYRASKQDRIESQLGFSGGPRNEGRSANASDPPRDERVRNHFEQLRWTRALAPEEELSVQLYHNYHHTSDTFYALGMVGNEDIHSERYDLELQHTRRLNDSWRVVWGAEARRDRVGGEGWFDTKTLIDSDLYRLFGNGEWRLAPDWVVNAGAMYEHNDITGGDVSPRLALNHHLDLLHTLRLSASRAYRTPSVLENQANAVNRLTSGAVGPLGKLYYTTENLRPEKITAYELGYLGQFPALGLVADMKIFREEIRDIIALPDDNATTPADPYATFRNDGEANINGAEVQLTLRPIQRLRIVFSQAYAHQRGQVLDDIAPTATTYIPTYSSTPVHTRSLLCQYDARHGLSASFAYYKTSAMQFLGGDRQPDTNTLDARLAWKLRMGASRGELAVVGQNLTGDYAEYHRGAVLDKRFYTTLSLDIQ